MNTIKRAPRVLSAIAANPPVAGKIAGALARGAFREARHMARTAQQRSCLRSKTLISKKYRFLWILIPKAASRSLLIALRNADPNAEKVVGRRLREVYARRPEIKDYYTFTFVRHPFDRALSWYCDVFLNQETYAEANTTFVRREDGIFFDDGTERSTRLPYDPSEVEDADARHKERKHRGFLRDYYGIAEASSFDDFCQWLNTPWGSDAFADQHFVSQHLLTDSEGKRPLDFVGRLENINADFNRVAASLGMSPPKLLLSNTRAGWLPRPEALKAARAAQELLHRHFHRGGQAVSRSRGVLVRSSGGADRGGTFPKTLWMLWLQGWENAPELVKRCLRSWQYHNPGWTIRALDAETLPAYIDLSNFSAAPEKDFTHQALSDIVRIELLATYGGVWVDAALFCRRPLDEWLFGYLDNGLFGFGRGQTPLCSFLAAMPGNRAVEIWRREMRAYWIGCPPRLRDSLRKRSPIGWVVEVSNDLARHVGDGMVPLHTAYAFWPLLVLGRWIRRHPSVYVSPLFRNVVKSAPYGWLFFLFKYCYEKHAEVRRIWNTVPKIDPINVTEQRLFGRLCQPLSEDTRRAIDDAHLPLYFLDWRLDYGESRAWDLPRPSVLDGSRRVMIDKPMWRAKALARLARTLGANPPIARDIVGALSRGAFGDTWRMARTVAGPPRHGLKLLSRKYRCLWMINLKVASRSIVAALRAADPDAERTGERSISELYAAHPEAREYYSFAFVRHPFARALSFYWAAFVSPRVVYTGEQRLHRTLNFRYLLDRFYGLAEVGSFEDYCEWLNTPYGSDAFADMHFLSQHVQINLGGHERLPDFIGRLENLDADMNRIAEHLGMPAPALPMLNTMAGWEATPDALKTARSAATETHLTERSKALLRTRYAKDFRLFGYSPD